jgi:hypothetical protein
MSLNGPQLKSYSRINIKGLIVKKVFYLLIIVKQLIKAKFI